MASFLDHSTCLLLAIFCCIAADNRCIRQSNAYGHVKRLIKRNRHDTSLGGHMGELSFLQLQAAANQQTVTYSRHDGKAQYPRASDIKTSHGNLAAVHFGNEKLTVESQWTRNEIQNFGQHQKESFRKLQRACYDDKCKSTRSAWEIAKPEVQRHILHECPKQLVYANDYFVERLYILCDDTGPVFVHKFAGGYYPHGNPVGAP
eukprot:GHVU01222867.1.p1 GENE.GHVU01222867.1~~GHVU01222867.1.p1  ORF type:complete len:204 (+),score=8.34 GHVU01222867.1:787-1398(+)